MSGALTLLFLLTVTLVIVRVASVALRLTGLPQPVARFQATSALTGTGFTTSEAEGTMHHPARRRILTLLMFAGHLGLVSLTSTVILAMTSTHDSSGAIIQIVAMLAAVGVICALEGATDDLGTRGPKSKNLCGRTGGGVASIVGYGARNSRFLRLVERVVPRLVAEKWPPRRAMGPTVLSPT